MKSKKQIIAEHNQLKAILSNFGFHLCAWDPGVSFYEKIPLPKDLLEANKRMRSLYKNSKRTPPPFLANELKQKYKYVYHNFEKDQWDVIKPLLEELIVLRKNLKSKSSSR